MAKKKHYASRSQEAAPFGHRASNDPMRGADWEGYSYNGADKGTKRNVSGSDESRYEGMERLDGRGQFANLPQQVVMQEWPKSPNGFMEEYPNGLEAANRQMKRDKKGIRKVGLPNRG